MRISEIVTALRTGNTYFNTAIGGALEFGRVQESTLMNEVAFVIPLGEEASSNDQDQSINQIIKERFGVVCAIKNDTDVKDKAGILAYDTLHDIRTDLLRVLINLDLGYNTTIEYSGARLLDLNRAWMWYQYEFVVSVRLSADGAGMGALEERDVDARQDPAQLPDFNKLYTDIILSPSQYLPYSGTLPVPEYMTAAREITNSDDDPNPGAYDSAFASGFRILLKNMLRR